MDLMNVHSLLKPGFFIKTQLSHANTWSVNTVLQVAKEFITIPLKEEYIASTVLINDVVKCRFSIGDNEITLLCLVQEIYLEAPYSMQLKVFKVDIWKNIRNSIRLEVKYLCRVTSNDSKRECIGVINNISESGCAVVCKEQLSTGSSVKVEFKAFDRIAFNVFAEVVRNKKTLDNKIEYGIRFMNMTEDEKQKINMVISQEKMIEDENFAKFCANYRVTPVLTIS